MISLHYRKNPDRRCIKFQWNFGTYAELMGFWQKLSSHSRIPLRADVTPLRLGSVDHSTHIAGHYCRSQISFYLAHRSSRWLEIQSRPETSNAYGRVCADRGMPHAIGHSGDPTRPLAIAYIDPWVLPGGSSPKARLIGAAIDQQARKWNGQGAIFHSFSRAHAEGIREELTRQRADSKARSIARLKASIDELQEEYDRLRFG